MLMVKLPSLFLSLFCALMCIRKTGMCCKDKVDFNRASLVGAATTTMFIFSMGWLD